MRLSLVYAFSIYLYSLMTYALPCTISIVKASCWQEYEVSVIVEDVATAKILANPVVKKGDLYSRASFECQPKQGLSMKAAYSPIIWDNDKGKQYPAVRFWYLPSAAPVEGSQWEIKICYPGQFASVPSPTGNVVNCRCDMSVLPPLK